MKKNILNIQKMSILQQKTEEQAEQTQKHLNQRQTNLVLFKTKIERPPDSSPKLNKQIIISSSIQNQRLKNKLTQISNDEHVQTISSKIWFALLIFNYQKDKNPDKYQILKKMFVLVPMHIDVYRLCIALVAQVLKNIGVKLINKDWNAAEDKNLKNDYVFFDRFKFDICSLFSSYFQTDVISLESYEEILRQIYKNITFYKDNQLFLRKIEDMEEKFQEQTPNLSFNQLSLNQSSKPDTIQNSIEIDQKISRSKQNEFIKQQTNISNDNEYKHLLQNSINSFFEESKDTDFQISSRIQQISFQVKSQQTSVPFIPQKHQENEPIALKNSSKQKFILEEVLQDENNMKYIERILMNAFNFNPNNQVEIQKQDERLNCMILKENCKPNGYSLAAGSCTRGFHNTSMHYQNSQSPRNGQKEMIRISDEMLHGNEVQIQENEQMNIQQDQLSSPNFNTRKSNLHKVQTGKQNNIFSTFSSNNVGKSDNSQFKNQSDGGNMKIDSNYYSQNVSYQPVFKQKIDRSTLFNNPQIKMLYDRLHNKKFENKIQIQHKKSLESSHQSFQRIQKIKFAENQNFTISNAMYDTPHIQGNQYFSDEQDFFSLVVNSKELERLKTPKNNVLQKSSMNQLDESTDKGNQNFINQNPSGKIQKAIINQETEEALEIIIQENKIHQPNSENEEQISEKEQTQKTKIEQNEDKTQSSILDQVSQINSRYLKSRTSQRKKLLSRQKEDNNDIICLQEVINSCSNSKEQLKNQNDKFQFQTSKILVSDLAKKQKPKNKSMMENKQKEPGIERKRKIFEKESLKNLMISHQEQKVDEIKDSRYEIQRQSVFRYANSPTFGKEEINDIIIQQLFPTKFDPSQQNIFDQINDKYETNQLLRIRQSLLKNSQNKDLVDSQQIDLEIKIKQEQQKLQKQNHNDQEKIQKYMKFEKINILSKIMHSEIEGVDSYRSKTPQSTDLKRSAFQSLNRQNLQFANTIMKIKQQNKLQDSKLQSQSPGVKIHRGRPKQSQITFKKINQIKKQSYASISIHQSPRYSEAENQKTDIKQKDKKKIEEPATKVQISTGLQNQKGMNRSGNVSSCEIRYENQQSNQYDLEYSHSKTLEMSKDKDIKIASYSQIKKNVHEMTFSNFQQSITNFQAKKKNQFQINQISKEMINQKDKMNFSKENSSIIDVYEYNQTTELKTQNLEQTNSQGANVIFQKTHLAQNEKESNVSKDNSKNYYNLNLITQDDEILENQIQDNINVNILDKIIYKDNIDEEANGISSLSRVQTISPEIDAKEELNIEVLKYQENVFPNDQNLFKNKELQKLQEQNQIYETLLQNMNSQQSITYQNVNSQITSNTIFQKDSFTNNQITGLNSDQVLNPNDHIDNQKKSLEQLSKMNENRKIHHQPKKNLKQIVNINNNQNQLLIEEVISEQKSPANQIAHDYLQQKFNQKTDMTLYLGSTTEKTTRNNTRTEIINKNSSKFVINKNQSLNNQLIINTERNGFQNNDIQSNSPESSERISIIRNNQAVDNFKKVKKPKPKKITEKNVQQIIEDEMDLNTQNNQFASSVFALPPPLTNTQSNKISKIDNKQYIDIDLKNEQISLKFNENIFRKIKAPFTPNSQASTNLGLAIGSIGNTESFINMHRFNFNKTNAFVKQNFYQNRKQSNFLQTAPPMNMRKLNNIKIQKELHMLNRDIDKNQYNNYKLIQNEKRNLNLQVGHNLSFLESEQKQNIPKTPFISGKIRKRRQTLAPSLNMQDDQVDLILRSLKVPEHFRVFNIVPSKENKYNQNSPNSGVSTNKNINLDKKQSNDIQQQTSFVMKNGKQIEFSQDQQNTFDHQKTQTNDLNQKNFLDIKMEKNRNTKADIYKILTSSRGDVKIVSRVKNSDTTTEQELPTHYRKITDIINAQNVYKQNQIIESFHETEQALEMKPNEFEFNEHDLQEIQQLERQIRLKTCNQVTNPRLNNYDGNSAQSRRAYENGRVLKIKSTKRNSVQENWLPQVSFRKLQPVLNTTIDQSAFQKARKYRKDLQKPIVIKIDDVKFEGNNDIMENEKYQSEESSQ